MEDVRTFAKKQMTRLAKWLDKISDGKITPNQITIASLLLHIPIFFAIIAQQYTLAAVMLVLFASLDALDGALARVQKVDSRAGMLLDASTDRMKESILFIALAYRFALDFEPKAVFAAVAAITGSFAVSYIKAKGEVAMKDSALSVQEINRVFQAGFMRYEIRTAFLVIGLLFTSLLIPIVWGIAILSWATAIYRLITISKEISN